MAHTNSTTHYGYPQFIGTDKPGWLTDVNNAYSSLDSDIYTAQTKADDAYTLANTADGKADTATLTANSALTNAGTANTNIGTMANLTTTEKTTLVGAINEIDGLIDNFNLTTYTIYDDANDYLIPSGTTMTSSANSITVAKNSDGSLCKIYGELRLNTSGSLADPTVTLNVDTGLRPENDITINPAGLSFAKATGNASWVADFNAINTATITIKTDGKLVFGFTTQPNAGANGLVKSIFLPCLYFVKDFGDVPTPQN